MWSSLLKEKRYLFALSIFYLLVFLYMLPLRNQAYGDDFAYIQSVQRTLETGRIYISNWSAPSLIFQIVWGSIFGKIFGPTAKAMHLSNIFLLYIAVLAFYSLLKRLKVETKKAFLFSIILFLFPWVFSYSYTFKTDVPYMSTVIIAIYFYTTAFQTKKPYLFFLANLAASSAFLIRQSGALIPISVILLLAHKYYINRKISLAEIFQAVGPTVIAIAIYLYWVGLPGNLTANQHEQLGIPILKNSTYFIPSGLGRLRAPNDNYLEYLRRIPFYLNNIFGFLTPILLLLKFSRTSLLSGFRKYRKAIFISFFIYAYLLICYYYSKFPFGLHYPIEILDFVHTPFSSSYFYWDLSLLVASFVIPILGAIVGQRALNYFFQPRKAHLLNLKALTLFILFGIFIVETKIYQIYLANHSLPSTTWALWALDKTKNMVIAIFLDAFQQNWVFLSLIGMAIITLLYLVTRFSLRKKTSLNLIYELLVYLALLHFIFMTFVYLQPWPEYVVSIVPFILIWLAKQKFIVTKRKITVVLLLLLLIYTSLIPIKERYENTGILWEIGTRLVEKGISPLKVRFIQKEWAWIPWWYYEDTFQEAVKNAGGNKYLLKGKSTFQSLQIGEKNIKTYFDIKEIPPYMSISQNSELKDYYLDTGPINYTFFAQKRFLIFEKNMQ